MGGSNKKNQKSSSVWTTTIEEDINKNSLPIDVEKVIQNIKDKDIDIHKPIPEVERLKKIFESKPYE